MIFETDRLYFREFTPQDESVLMEFFADPLVIQYMNIPIKKVPYTLRRDLRDYKNSGFGMWAVIYKETGELIGRAGGSPMNKDGKLYADIGWAIVPELWHQGYGWEIAQGVVGYFQKHINVEALIGRAAPENKAALRIIEKLGMKKLGEDTNANRLWFVLEKNGSL